MSSLNSLSVLSRNNPSADAKVPGRGSIFRMSALLREDKSDREEDNIHLRGSDDFNAKITRINNTWRKKLSEAQAQGGNKRRTAEARQRRSRTSKSTFSLLKETKTEDGLPSCSSVIDLLRPPDLSRHRFKGTNGTSGRDEGLPSSTSSGMFDISLIPWERDIVDDERNMSQPNSSPSNDEQEEKEDVQEAEKIREEGGEGGTVEGKANGSSAPNTDPGQEAPTGDTLASAAKVEADKNSSTSVAKVEADKSSSGSSESESDSDDSEDEDEWENADESGPKAIMDPVAIARADKAARVLALQSLPPIRATRVSLHDDAQMALPRSMPVEAWDVVSTTRPVKQVKTDPHAEEVIATGALYSVTFTEPGSIGIPFDYDDETGMIEVIAAPRKCTTPPIQKGDEVFSLSSPHLTNVLAGRGPTHYCTEWTDRARYSFVVTLVMYIYQY